MEPERIGLFGGTFDPPHLGHLILASAACEQLDLSRLLWILTPEPPHKQNQSITSTEQRLDMIQLAIRDDPRFELSRIELERPGPHYTLDTVNFMRQLNPGKDVVLLIGGDSLHNLPAWHRPADLIAACNLIGVIRRPGNSAELTELEKQLPGITTKVRFVDAPLLEIASREIRRRATQGRFFRYYVPASVYDYIQKYRLYQQK
jgi:nicotinate-nucleotide adenylyltransferase